MTTPYGLEPQGEPNIPAGLKPMIREYRPAYIYMTPAAYFGSPADDAQIFNTANAYLISKYGQGTVELAPMTFTARSQATPTWGNPAGVQNAPGNVNVLGNGANTVWAQNFSGIAWYAHRTGSYGGQFGSPAQPAVGFVRNFVLDGTNAGNNSTGYHYGDGWGRGLTNDLRIQNYSGTNCIGAQQQNVIAPSFWMEKTVHQFEFSNCTTTFNIDQGAGSNSAEYNEYHIAMFCQQNQQGITLTNGINMGGSNLFLYGNMSVTTSSSGTPPNNIGMLSLFNGSRWYYGTIMAKIEGNPGVGGGTTYPWTVYSDGTGYIRQCDGRLTTSLNDIKMNGAEFGFAGFIGGNPQGGLLYPTSGGGTSTSPPSVPGSNTWFRNTSVSQYVTISGGTVSSIKVGTPNTNVTIGTSGSFLLMPGCYFNITYSVAPTTFVMVPTGAGD
jgi:hypothetical protein